MKLVINRIHCIKTCSGIEADNVFLIIQADGGLPIFYPAVGSVRMSAGDDMELPEDGYTVDFEYGFVVTAWDRDSFIFKGLDSPDFLFNFDACRTSPSSYTQTIYNHNGAEYQYTRTISQ